MALFTTLYSGSSGNCGLVLQDNKYLLIDMGKSCRTTLNALRKLNLSVSDCQGILITHEHSDHIRGLPLFAKRYGTPVYASYGTWASMQGQLPLPGRQRMEFDPDQDFYIDGVNVSPFPIPHDTPMPVGYSLECMGKKVSFATDLGHTTPKILGCVARSDVLLLEANHDVEMLKAGPYPYSLKKRILGRYGHLSNDACASALAALLPTGVRRVFLGHLSQENNSPELALSAATSTALALGAELDGDVFLRLTYQDRAAEPVLL